ncbi:MAG: hypothetical protein FJ398_23465 [Verrucomicrobia bacterium]|nr:hypothetical protein [Verrucomicrobiota bacterium]
MAFEDDFDTLDRLLLAKSTDYEKMHATLQAIRRLKEFAQMMSPAQDRLYASVARGHRKVLGHLEVGDVAAATREATKAVAWFYVRFQGDDPNAMTQCPEVAEELLKVRAFAARSETLREAIGKTTGREIHDT